MKNKKKLLTLIVSTSLITGCILGGTLAWLTDKTNPITNTFTIGNVDIDLKEETGETYKMIPGVVLPKDPTVIVEAGSEACWLFVKVEESEIIIPADSASETPMPKAYTFSDFITYDVKSEWTELSAENGVYYRSVESLADATEDIKYPVIGYYDAEENWIENSVLVNTTVTKEMMDDLFSIGEENYPKLTFTAYAVQQAGIETPEVAWAEISK